MTCNLMCKIPEVTTFQILTSYPYSNEIEKQKLDLWTL